MNTNYPSTGGFSSEPKKDNKGTIIIVLLIALIGSWVYFFYSKNQTDTLIVEKDVQYSTLDSSKNAVQKEYDDAIIRLQEMTQTSVGLDSLVKSKDNEMQALKSKFRALVSKQNASTKDLAEARQLVGELNGKIDDYVKEIERLQTENQQLTVDKVNLTSDKQSLEKNLSATEIAKKEAENKVDVGSTLHASNFRIIAINETNSGKEKSTARANRADKMRISFVLDENRIASTGTKMLYILAKDPAGNIIKESEISTGKFETRNDGQLDFTNKLDVQYTQGEQKLISFDLKQTDKYVKGNYNMVVYQNGFKIGEGIAVLK